jgi:hypothetical protein
LVEAVLEMGVDAAMAAATEAAGAAEIVGVAAVGLVITGHELVQKAVIKESESP